MSVATIRPRTNNNPGINYVIGNLRLTLKRSAYLVFVIAMPLVMFLLFNEIYGSQTQGNVNAGTYVMLHMAAYGALGAAMSSGATLQLERRSGWFRQLSVAGLSGRSFLLGKLVTSLVLMLPTIALVFAAGSLNGVHLTGSQWLRSGLLIWVSMLPMVLFGLVIALWFAGDAAQPATTIIMIVLAMVGGLWFPAEFFPHVLQLIAKATPVYWIGRLADWPVGGGTFPWQGVAVLAGWTALLVALSVVGYRRASRTSKR